MEKFTPADLVKAGLGAMLIAKEKAEEMIDEAIKEGEMSKEEGSKVLDDLKKEAQKRSKEIDKSLKTEIHKQLKEFGVATKEDIASLRREITALKHAIEKK